LYNQFLDVLQAFRISSPLQLLEILQYFIDNCMDTISILKDQNQVKKKKLYNFFKFKFIVLPTSVLVECRLVRTGIEYMAFTINTIPSTTFRV